MRNRTLVAHAIAFAVWMPTPIAGHAAVTPKAQAIVERYLQATGGAAALAAERSVRVKGRFQAIELKGTFEQWSQVPDRLVTRISLGPLRLRTGFDGSVGWETDLNSKQVRVLEGRELEKLRSDAYFENEMWARPDQGGGRIAHGASAFRSGDVFHSIEVTPPVGPPRRLWFSDKTGLLSRVVTRVDQHESDYWLSEYRKYGGRKRPAVQAADDQRHPMPGEQATPDRFMVDSVWVNARVDSTWFAPPASRERAVAWLKTRGVARVPFRYGSRHVWIKASINGGPPMDFLLDTGASITAIDLDYAEKIGLTREGRFQAQGIGGSDAASFARVASIRVGGPKGDGVTARDFKVGIVNLGESHEHTLWRRMGGLIGYDFLSRFVVELDYDRQVVTFRDPKAFEYRGAGAALDMKLVSGIPVVRAQLDDGCSGDFLVDVGNGFGLNVHGSLVRGCGIFRAVGGRKQVKVFGGGVGGSFASWLCRLDTLRLGPFALPEPIAGLSLTTRGMVGSKDYAGNIGNGVLERFTCTFDYQRKKLYLEPGRRFVQRDRFSRVGVHFARLGERVVAWGILHGTQADEAGLKAGDEVLEIDGKPATSYTPEEMDRLFVDGELGSTHTLTVMHDGKTTKLTLVLQDVI